MKYIIVSLLIIVLSGCTQQQSDSTQVYEAIFNYFSASQPVKQNTFYVKQHVKFPKFDNQKSSAYQLFNEFKFNTSLKQHNLTNFGKSQITLLNNGELNSTFKNGCSQGWKSFHSKYPKATFLLSISTVGYNSNNEAMVYVEAVSGCLAARGDIIIFEKVNGEWKYKKNFLLWVS